MFPVILGVLIAFILLLVLGWASEGCPHFWEKKVDVDDEPAPED